MTNQKTEQYGQTDRKPYAAGAFYPNNSELLMLNLKNAFLNAKPKISEGEVLAIVCPHAGYIYSAKIAASAFNQIDTAVRYEHIFIIGSSHRVEFNGASIYTQGDYITPLGHINTDTLGNKLIKDNSVFTSNPTPHLDEHTIEVQLPFLQYLFHGNFNIVPIVLGTQSRETCRKIANALQPYFTPKNLFVFSTDFSHYPAYESAKKVDSIVAGAVATNNPESFLSVLNKEENKNIPGLFTGMCGWTSVLTMLYMTSTIPEINIRKVDYQNSGDTESGDKSKVVGYVALSVERKHNIVVSLSVKDKTDLLKLARESINTYLKSGIIPEPDESDFSLNTKQLAGAFVTLTIDGELRGCIGKMISEKPLYKTIRDMAIASAVKDYRFKPLNLTELDNARIEISILTPMRKISSINEIKLGKNGIYIIKGGKSGTLLPQVSVEHNLTVEEFLGYCSRDKAGLGWEGWKDAEIFVYEAILFSE